MSATLAKRRVIRTNVLALIAVHRALPHRAMERAPDFRRCTGAGTLHNLNRIRALGITSHAFSGWYRLLVPWAQARRW